MSDNSRDIRLEKQIDLYLKGHLTEKETDVLWTELLEKPHYIDLLETELHVKAIVEQRRQVKPTHHMARYWKWITAAAVIGILAGSLSLLRDSANTAALAWPSINLTEHLASPDIARTAEPNLSQAEAMLYEGFKAAVSGQPDNALHIFERITASQTGHTVTVSQAYYNMGIIYYNSEHFMEASVAFSRALDEIEEDAILFKEKTQWFLAQTRLQLNKPEKAREAIEQVYSMDGIYRDHASELLEKLGTEPASRTE